MQREAIWAESTFEQTLKALGPEESIRLLQTDREGSPLQGAVLTDQAFFLEHQIYMNRHARYIGMPLHSHTFLELNYMYAGSCTQFIEGEPVLLEQGDLLLIHPGISHSIKALGAEDILINILVRSGSVNTTVLHKMARHRSVITDFLLSVNKHQYRNHTYLHVQSKAHERLQHCLSYLIEDYFGYQPPRYHKAELWLPVIFAEMEELLMRDIEAMPYHSNVREAISMIEQEYRTLTLSELARRLNFNKNYLSSLIKEETGLTFKEWVNKRRLQEAYDLLISSSLSIEEIAHQIGLGSPSYFYRIFKKAYGTLPSQFRRRLHTAGD
ncbi:AraC family transcriptional regulator [Paenibacillus sp. MMS20-IR301]|uniref:AraC family transcriptional regulator n=1 Tax=Paenibacillus sp. MMS20-IR301 TaxID=2895946 RepID=UPI0028EC22D5|nr:AraC family transcriptional regulator [Paenibacillus sp. MMS20-IR301]WNS40738.1 AraC family transcriptional regulator [Paenibacillus sp. MMS20-IR301]